MTYRFTLWVLLLSALLLEEAGAQTPLRKRIGIGFSLGEPTSVTMRFRMGRSSSMDFAVGKTVMGYRVHADYHWQHLFVFGSPVYSLYTGLGAAVAFGEKGKYFVFNSKADSSRWFFEGDYPAMGRGTIGLNIIPIYTPIEIFAEINPLIGFHPKLALDIEASIGVRYYP